MDVSCVRGLVAVQAHKQILEAARGITQTAMLQIKLSLAATELLWLGRLWYCCWLGQIGTSFCLSLPCSGLSKRFLACRTSSKPASLLTPSKVQAWSVDMDPREEGESASPLAA